MDNPKAPLPVEADEEALNQQLAQRDTVMSVEDERRAAEEHFANLNEQERNYVRLVVDDALTPAEASRQVGLRDVAGREHVIVAIASRTTVQGYLERDLASMLPAQEHMENLRKLGKKAEAAGSYAAALGAELARGKLAGHYNRNAPPKKTAGGG